MPAPDQDYSTEEGVVKDDLYILNEEHGHEEYDPNQQSEEPIDLTPTRKTPPILRESTVATRENPGIFAEGEDEFEEGPSLTAKDSEKNPDSSRQLSSLVAASHRVGRSPDAKRASAEKASALHEEITGQPLEINEEGEVVTDSRISSG
ncbi:hypothetical protein G9A89_000049 [Geosiphon pyriformis]|nr:hypothetical protein G9A89_000049 [Geosiphon pyriformis]